MLDGKPNKKSMIKGFFRFKEWPQIKFEYSELGEPISVKESAEEDECTNTEREEMLKERDRGMYYYLGKCS